MFQMFYQKITAVIKLSEYSSLGKELKKQTSVVETQYQRFNNAFESKKRKKSKQKAK